MPALINIVGVVSDAAALMVVRGDVFLLAFDKPQRDALALLFLKLRDQQNTAAEILWGVCCCPCVAGLQVGVSCRGSWASGSPSAALPM